MSNSYKFYAVSEIQRGREYTFSTRCENDEVAIALAQSSGSVYRVETEDGSQVLWVDKNYDGANAV